MNLHRGILDRLNFTNFFHFMLYIMHHIRRTDLEVRVDYALEMGGKYLFDESQKGIDRFQLFRNYLIKASRYLRREVMAQVIEKNLSETKSKDFDTWAERERYEGKLEGKIEGKIETARMMKAEGDSIEKILRVTGLSKDALEKIL